MSQEDLREREKELRLLEAGFAPSAVYVATALALAGIVVTRTGFTPGTNASSYATGCFLFSAVLFFFAMDFTLLAMWYEEHRTTFGIIISGLYGLGQLLVPIGVSLSMLAVGFRVAAYVFLTAYVAGFVGFNIIRWVVIGPEEPFKIRFTLRAFNLAVLLLAYIVVLTTRG